MKKKVDFLFILYFNISGWDLSKCVYKSKWCEFTYPPATDPWKRGGFKKKGFKMIFTSKYCPIYKFLGSK